jgi:transcriptional regulator with XRE-family HTH domain
MNDFMVETMQSEEQRKAFGMRVKEFRNQRRWTQKEVAARIGLKLSQFNKYEAGMHMPPADKLLQLAEMFGTTTDYLLTGAVTDLRPISNVRLMERFQALAQCQPEEQEAVIRLIDAVIVKNRVETAMQPLGGGQRGEPEGRKT